jgi:hypothetical protein
MPRRCERGNEKGNSKYLNTSWIEVCTGRVAYDDDVFVTECAQTFRPCVLQLRDECVLVGDCQAIVLIKHGTTVSSSF